MYPEDLKYAKTHEWVRVEGNEATVGISDHAQSELGDVVYVDLPEVGAKISAGGTFGSIESVKTVSDLISPVTGEVIERNSVLSDSPEVINENPHTDGWLIKVAIEDPNQVNNLMTAEQYEKFIQE